MPRAYRVMKAEGNPPKPFIGDSATKLGVRERDLRPNNGNAIPGRGGVSVVSSIYGLRDRVAKLKFPPDMVPQRLSDMGLVPGAIGRNDLHLFRIGVGKFEAGPLTDLLRLVPDDGHHGTIQPSSILPYATYKEAIYGTRDQWVSGENDQ